MFKTLVTICKDYWKWRKQIFSLAKYELIKQVRGAALGWLWIFLKPAIFIACFWFVLEIGLKQGSNMSPPFFLWLVTGLVAWFYMSDILGGGSDVLHKFSYLVSKIKFPLSAISGIYVVSSLVEHLGLMLLVIIIFFVYGVPPEIYAIQLPFLLVLMVMFFTMFSILTSQLSAMSKDFKSMLSAFTRPLFWLSGILFNVADLPMVWIQRVELFNPVYFFATSYRKALYYKVWIWEDPMALVSFAAVFLLTFVVMLLVYKRVNKEVYDVL